MTELRLVDDAIAVSVKHREGLVHVKIVDEERCCDLIEHLVKSLLPQIDCFKAIAESFKVNFTDAFGVCNTAHDTLVLHVKRQVQGVNALLEDANRDSVVIFKVVIVLLEGVIETDFSRTEDICDLIDKLLLTLDSLRVLRCASCILPLQLFLIGSDLISHFSKFACVKKTFLLLLLGCVDSFRHVSECLVKRLLEVFELNEVQFDVGGAVNEFCLLSLSSAALHSIVSQHVDVIFGKFRDARTDDLLELLTSDDSTGVLLALLTESHVDLVVEFFDVLESAFKKLGSALKLIRSDGPLSDVKLRRNDFCMSNLLDKVVYKQSLRPVFVSVSGNQVELLFGNFEGYQLENLPELDVSDKTTVLGKNAENVAQVKVLRPRVDLDLSEDVLVILHRVGILLNIDLELVFATSLRCILRLNEETDELVVIDCAVITETFKLVLKTDHFRV